ncbi:MAG TPA: sigma-70 family RNA polymerase sigma factor [Pyrinomonadaceae bacterium]|jgi:RNA polymerase sigma factor (sigma-70 family)|nr:sigma-70 family RNA polymerase sigma factor [Pyrinomonadaceae bacterium]
MARDSAIPPESFEEILAWLNADRDVAAVMYVQLRHDLAKLFMWGRCGDPEGLTDEAFDRVAKKIHEVRPTYEGDPRLYFRAVANNLIKENHKKVKTHVPLEDVDLPDRQTTEIDEEIAADMEECLQLCLQKLGANKRELILAYYAKEKQAKIDHRNELAQKFGITVETLRVRVFRIRESLAECIERCLKRKAQGK